MNYKSKYTASEIDARLSQVFDSTLQTKEVEVSEDTTIKADEGFLGLKEVNVKVSGGGGAVDKIGMIYVHKKDIMAVFEFPSDGTVPNDELLGLMLQLSALPIVAFKGTPVNADKVISYSSAISEEIAESRFTYDAWSYTALDFDRLTFGVSDRGELPAWNMLSGNFADAKAIMDAMFPTRITEEEFYTL